MEKVIRIGDKDIKFKASAGTPRRYRQVFRRDMMKDMAQLINKIKPEGDEIALTEIDLEIFENVAYIMARQGDFDNTPDTPDDWLDQFDLFPFYDVFPQIIELWGDNVETMVDSKKKADLQSGK